VRDEAPSAPLAPFASLAPFAPSAAYLILAAAWLWPLPIHVASRFAHDPGDPLLNTFILWWNAHALPLSRTMWNAPFYWPMHDALALTEHLAGIAAVASPVQWLGGSALLAYNLTLIASFWWSGLAVHALVRRLTGQDSAAWCAGVVWLLAPYRASQLSHLQVLVTWWMPTALLALHAYYDEGRWRWLALFGLSWLLLSLSNGYYMFFFPVLVAGWIAVFTRSRGDVRRAAAVVAVWLLCSLPLLPVLLEYSTVQGGLNLARTRTEMQMFGATWTSFVHGSPLLRFWPFHAARTQEDFLFPGNAGTVAVLAALVLRRGAVVSRQLAFYASGALICGWLSFGPSPVQWSLASLWHAYDWIAWLPGFGGLRVPARFFMLATLCLAVAAGIAVAALAQNRRRALVATSMICALAVVDGWIGPLPLGTPPQALGTPLEAGAHVLELPVDDDLVNIAAMYRVAFHRRPTVNGYAGYLPPQMSVIEWALGRRDASVLTELRRGYPLYVVVVASHPSAPEWTAFMDAQPDAQLIGITGAGRLYRLPAAPFAPQVSPGDPLVPVRSASDSGWITLDLGAARTVRAVELRTRGHFALVRGTLRVETSLDGRVWHVPPTNHRARWRWRACCGSRSWSRCASCCPTRRRASFA
jgi:hypothetical protein